MWTSFFAYVDFTTALHEWSPEGTRYGKSIIPDDVDPDALDAAWAIQQSLAATLKPYDTEWSLRILAGRPPLALHRLAQHLGASMIVVGGRKSGLWNWIEQVLAGAIEVQLGTIQERPVIVVPARPTGRHLRAQWFPRLGAH